MHRLSATLVATLLVSSIIISCKVSNESIAGTYTNSFTKDTLQMFPNSTYTYVDKSTDTSWRHTKGTWRLDKKFVHFSTLPNKIKIEHNAVLTQEVPDSVTTFSIYWGEGLGAHPIPVKAITGYTSGKTTALRLLGTNLPFNINNFDSVVVQTYFYTDLILKKEYCANGNYGIRYCPKERPYTLDRFGFRFKKSRLIRIADVSPTHDFIVYEKVPVNK